MLKKKDDLEKLVEEYSKNLSFVKKLKEEEDKLRIAVKIAELREKKGVTQKELAKKIHTTQSVISRLESADYKSYSVPTLKKIADALNVKLVIDFK